jgi:FAD/FMN-containing dehydrogenase
MAFYPEDLTQLQTIIQSANTAATPLVPVSSAPPHLHGASKNEQAETVSFEKMSRILKIDRPGRYVRVEAGVTYEKLMPAVKAAGPRLNHPFLPRAGKSVSASLLEREGGIAAKYQYDYTDPLLNAEIVYGTGDVFRTGSAAGPGPIEELTADMVCPWGPGTIDFIRFLCGAQGTMGFVTWTTIKAEILPTLGRLFFIVSDDPGKLTRLASKLLRNRIPDDCIILNRVNFAAAFSSDAARFSDLIKNSPPWILLCRICGYERYPEERIRIYTGYLQDHCREAGQADICGYQGMLPD